jgi:hypothetical protein
VFGGWAGSSRGRLSGLRAARRMERESCRATGSLQVGETVSGGGGVSRGALVARIDGEEEDVLVVSKVCHYRDTLADLDTKQTENSKSVLVELSSYM